MGNYIILGFERSCWTFAITGLSSMLSHVIYSLFNVFFEVAPNHHHDRFKAAMLASHRCRLL